MNHGSDIYIIAELSNNYKLTHKIMKKITLMMGIAALALTSCLKDTVTETNNGRPIDFRVSAQTRATETTTGNLVTFYVTSLMENGSTYFEDLAFVKGTSTFVSSPEYYWPASGSLDFYAYAPAADKLGGTLTISNTEQKLTGYSPASNISDQKDFVVATASGNKTQNAAGVALTFNHMLSQIEIHAKNLHEGYTYLVKGVSINGVIATGDFNFADSKWTLGTDKTNYTVTYDYPVTLTATGEVVMDMVDIDGTELPDNAMLLPQNLATVAPKATLGIYVQCKSTSGAQVFPETTGDYGWMYVDIDTNWEAGCKYVYTLDLTRGYQEFHKIQFTMDVTPWVEKSTLDDEDIDLTGTWRMARVEQTDTYNDGKVEKYVYDTKETILEAISDHHYELKVVKELKGDLLENNENAFYFKYYTYPGTSNQESYDFIVQNGKMIIDLGLGDGVMKEGYLVRDISENFITFSQKLDITNTANEVTGNTELVFYYVRIADIPLYQPTPGEPEGDEVEGGEEGN